MPANTAAMLRVAAEAASVTVDGADVPLAVRRSPRARRMHLRLDVARGVIELVLPRWVALAEGMAFAGRHRGWVKRRLAALPPAIPFADGVTLSVFGDDVVLRHDLARRGPALREGAELWLGGEFPARRARDWLKGEARRVLAPQAHALAARVTREIRAIRFGDPATRWGSCSPAGVIALSWRLALAPPRVAAYVVAHEVAHLVEANHGRRFWRVVNELFGDPTHERAWLAQSGAQLLRYG